jgi:lipopolysaccharide/colanic/teichoic acid biosynthesis glycosyltransferase
MNDTRAMKRMLDVAFSAAGLVLLSPLVAVIMAAIKLHDGGPVYHRARRVGLNGKVFLIYKFRTMTVNADKIGSGITVANDNRITPIGHLLRKHALDEFPQLINVVRGEMSLVGPRPEDPRYTALYDQNQRRILSVLPGITSPASLSFINESSLLDGPDFENKYVTEILAKKLAIDLDYFDHNTFWSDLGVIVRTIIRILR